MSIKPIHMNNNNNNYNSNTNTNTNHNNNSNNHNNHNNNNNCIPAAKALAGVDRHNIDNRNVQPQSSPPRLECEVQSVPVRLRGHPAQPPCGGSPSRGP